MLNQAQLWLIRIEQSESFTSLFVNLLICLKTIVRELVTFQEEVYVISDLNCNILIVTDIMKSKSITIQWSSKESNYTRIEKSWISVWAIKNDIFLTRIILSLQVSRVAQITTVAVYVTEAVTIQSDHDKNISVQFWVLSKVNYFFEPVPVTDLLLSVFYTDFKTLITDCLETISVVNLDVVPCKIAKNKLLEHMTTLVLKSQSLIRDLLMKMVFEGKYEVNKEPDLLYLI